VDFAEVIQSVGERDIPVVGLSFVGNQARFVVTNRYMDAVLDFNKTASGIETCMVGQNTVTDGDAAKAVAVLKNRMRGAGTPGPYPDRLLRRLRKQVFRMDGLRLGDRSRVSDGILTVDAERARELTPGIPEIAALGLRAYPPGDLGADTNSILDIWPLTAKQSGNPGEGVTLEAGGVRVLLSAVECGGFQPANIGSSEGLLREKLYPGRPGTPDASDWILHVDVLLAEWQGRTRQGIMAAHRACDLLLKPLRDALRAYAATAVSSQKKDLLELARPGRPRVLLIKLVSGLGCMYDTSLFPNEPGGFLGSRSIMELSNNLPIMLSPNEYRDGAVHSLC
jgi:hypothetical protein